MNPNPNPEERNRIITDVFKNSKLNPDNQRKPSMEELTLTKAQATINEVITICKQVIDADPVSKAAGFDRKAMGSLVMKLLMERFDKWSKDELFFLCTVLHTGLLMERLEELDNG